ncbi:type II secretion system protein N [Thalassotalea psychrophila]|uniref:Type II secretion system protein N n=1 Tax=Thalassotalea psychrophila TaxID=3065647 RepID=A0ABY9TVT5_9GAMM|nr:type II secretion system protein N [Colwelliaceae bacterium SQ149]
MQLQDIKKYSAIVAGFIALYLIFLISLAPADKLISQISLPKGVSLQGISGSAFSGKAKSVTINKYTVENVQWSVSLLSLITFDPSVAVNFGDRLSSVSGSMDLSNLGPELLVENAHVIVDANEVVTQLNLPIDMNAGGQVTLDILAIGLGKPVCAIADGVMQWDNANVNAMDEDIDLGSLKATLACNEGALAITIDPKNDLGLELTANVASMRRITADGYLTPGNKFPSALKPVLGFIGKKDSKGRYTIRL